MKNKNNLKIIDLDEASKITKRYLSLYKEKVINFIRQKSPEKSKHFDFANHESEIRHEISNFILSDNSISINKKETFLSSYINELDSFFKSYLYFKDISSSSPHSSLDLTNFDIPSILQASKKKLVEDLKDAQRYLTELNEKTNHKYLTPLDLKRRKSIKDKQPFSYNKELLGDISTFNHHLFSSIILCTKTNLPLSKPLLTSTFDDGIAIKSKDENDKTKQSFKTPEFYILSKKSLDNYINNITKILNIHINNEDRFISLLKYIKSEITRETTVLSYDFKSFDEFNMLDKKDILNLQNNFIKMIFKKIYNSLDKNHDLDDGLKIDIINTLSHGLNNHHGGGNHDGYGMAP